MYTFFFDLSKILQEGVPVQVPTTSSVNVSMRY
jgi:hypothetical protein